MSPLLQALNTPWAILPEKLHAIMAVLLRHEAGVKLSAEEIAAVSKPGRPSSISGGIQVLPLFGTIAARSNLMTEASGGTSAELFGKAFKQAIADPNIGAIVIDVDSPGGTVQGVDELANDIYKARGTKPIVAVANHLAASAAYWIATAADEFMVSPSGEVGSIGVFAAHEDVSEALTKEGVKVNLISAGKFKTEGNPYEPLSEESRASIQKRVDEYYGMFTAAVARNRGVAVTEVRNGFGEGRVVGAKEAVSLGMADRIGTLEDAISRLQKRAKGVASARAEVEYHKQKARALSV